MAYYYSPFRSEYSRERARTACVFCEKGTMEKQSVLDARGSPVENEHYRWIVNWFPKAEASTMLVPKRHITALGDETKEEVVARHNLLRKVETTFKKLFEGAGIEVFFQTGAGSEGSVPHLHWHALPGLSDDEPRGMRKFGSDWTGQEGEEKVVLYPREIKLARVDLQKVLAEVL